MTFRLRLTLALVVGLISSSPLAARTLVVTNAADAIVPPPGSLREALYVTAAAGDTIVFARPFVVTLVAKLQVDTRLTGVTIQGPGGIRDAGRGVMEIATDNVTIQNFSFENVNLFALPGTTGFKLVENRFGLEGSVSLDQTRNALIARNAMRVGNRFGDPAILASRTENCEIAENSLEVTHSLASYDLMDSDSTGLNVRKNTFKRGLKSSLRSGTITENTVEGPKGCFIPHADFADSGHVDILKNHFTRLFVNRTDVTIAENILRPAGPHASVLSLLHVLNDDPAGATGPVQIRDNDLEGGWVGIHYAESDPPRSGTAEIRGNKIGHARGKGLVASGLRDGSLVSNTVTDCGSGTTGVGIELLSTRADGTAVALNTVTGTTGVGLRFNIRHSVHAASNVVSQSTAEGIRATTGSRHLIARDNRVFANGRDGIVFAPNSTGDVSGGEVFDNTRAGILVDTAAAVRISQVAFHNNTGPGIDLAPREVTPNDVPKLGNRDLDWPAPLFLPTPSGKLRGLTIPHGIVEVFQIEGGARTGNPANGEGQTYLATVVADALGFFTYPAEGTLNCPPAPALTFTVTTPGEAPVTSEFSPGPNCETHSNLAPVIVPPAPQNTPANEVRTVPVTVEDLETPTESLQVSATSSDPAIATVAVTGTGADRQIVVTPVGNAGGTVTITVSVTDTGSPPGTNPHTTTTTFPVTVTPVNTPPATLVTASNRNNPTGVYLTFSGPLDPATVGTLANYTSGLGILEAKVGATPNEIELRTGPQTEGFNYTLQARNLRDALGRPVTPEVIFAVIQLGQGVVAGGIVSLRYGGPPKPVTGTDISQLLNDPNYPHNPTLVTAPLRFEIPVNVADNYGAVLRGLYKAPATGNYRFYLSSDDQGELWLSTNDDPARIRRIAYEPAWNGDRQYINGQNQASRGNPPANCAEANLVAGQTYYLEARVKEGAGGDNLSVAVQTPGGTAVANGTLPIGSGSFSPSKWFQGEWFTKWGAVSVRTTPDQNVTGNPGQVVKLQATPDGSPPFRFQWNRDGSPVPGATAREWNVTLSDATQGTYTVRVENDFSSVLSDPIVLSGPPDAAPPTILGIEVLPPGNDLALRLSEPVNPTDAGALGSYALTAGDGSSMPLSGTRLLGKTVRLATNRQLSPGTDYTLTTTQPIRDTSPQQNPLPAGTRITVNAPHFTPGFAQLEFFGVNPRNDRSTPPPTGTIPGESVEALLSHPTFPNQPTAVCASQFFASGPFDRGNNYGGRISGWFVPPTSGDYRFYISSDDQSKLWLSTDADPANQRLIAQETSWSAMGTWYGPSGGRTADNTANVSAPQALEAGKPYHLELLWKEGGGGDHAGLAVQGPGDPPPLIGSLPWHGSAILNPFVPFPRAIKITQQPTDQLVIERDSVELSVTIEGAPPELSALCGQPFYQWYRDGVPVPGANSPTYRIELVTFDDSGSIFTCQIAIPGANVTSDPAILHVFSLPHPGTLVSAASADGSQIGLIFNAPISACGVDPYALIDPSGYRVEDTMGIKVIDRIGCGPLPGTLTIHLDAGQTVGQEFTVTVPGGATVLGTTWMFGVNPIGNPIPTGGHFTAQNGDLDLYVGGGVNWWDGSDDALFAYVGQTESGPFDVAGWFAVGDSLGECHACLEARESTDPGSPAVAICLSAEGPGGPPGSTYVSLRHRPAAGADWWVLGEFSLDPEFLDGDGALGLRIGRTGNELRCYFYDQPVGGWSQVGSPIPWIGPAVVGVAGASSGEGRSATIEVRDLGPTQLCPTAEIAMAELPLTLVVEVGDEASLQCEATLTNPGSCQLRYQWQIETAPGTGQFVDLEWATAPVLRLGKMALVDSDRRYRCRVTAGLKTIVTDPTTLFVVEPAPPPNTPPSFTLSQTSISAVEGSGPVTLPGFVTGISSGTPPEVGQQVNFQVTAQPSALFSTQPTIHPDGTLTFAPAPGATGTATITVVAKDNGGTANGGQDSSAPQTFQIHIQPASSDLSLSLLPGGDSSVGSESVLRYFRVENHTSSIARNAEITVVCEQPLTLRCGDLPGIGCTAISADTLRFVVPQLAGGTAVELPVLLAATGDANGPGRVLAHVTSTTNDPFPDNNLTARLFSVTGQTVPAPKFPSVQVVRVAKITDTNVHLDTDVGGVFVEYVPTGPVSFLNVSVNGQKVVENAPLLTNRGGGEPEKKFVPIKMWENADGTWTIQLDVRVTDRPLNVWITDPKPATVTRLITCEQLGHTGTQALHQPAPGVPLGDDVEEWAAHDRTFPNQPQGRGECVPAAVSNSLKYLNDRFGLGLDPAELTIEKMMAAVGWIDVFQGREIFGAPNQNAGANWWAHLKDAYMQAKGFGIVTETTRNPQVALNELKRGHDVEIDWNGHTAAVVGIARLKNGKFRIEVAHDLYQDGRYANDEVIEAGIEIDPITGTSVGHTWGSSQPFLSFVIERPANVRPSVPFYARATDEDVPLTDLVVGQDHEGDPLEYRVTKPPQHGSLEFHPKTGFWTYTPGGDYFGPDSFEFVANDGKADSRPGQVTLTVRPVNDAPRVELGLIHPELGDTVTVAEDSGPHRLEDFADSVSGPKNEADQTVTYRVSVAGGADRFALSPSIAPDGTLTFGLLPNVSGDFKVRVEAVDSGDGQNTSAPREFNLVVTPVNDAPSFNRGPDQVVSADAGPQVEPGWVTVIDPGPNESGQSVQVHVSTDAPQLFVQVPAISDTGTLTFTPAPGKAGKAILTITVKDDGGTANGGKDTSAPVTAAVTIAPEPIQVFEGLLLTNEGLPSPGNEDIPAWEFAQMLDQYLDDGAKGDGKVDANILGIFALCFGGDFLAYLNDTAGEGSAGELLDRVRFTNATFHSANAAGEITWSDGAGPGMISVTRPGEVSINIDAAAVSSAVTHVLVDKVTKERRTVAEKPDYVGSLLRKVGGASSTHVLVWAGLPELRHERLTQEIIDQFAGHPNTTIDVLSGQRAPGGFDLKGTPVTFGPATRNNLRAVLEKLGSLMKAGPDEQFVFFGIDHGASNVRAVQLPQVPPGANAVLPVEIPKQAHQAYSFPTSSSLGFTLVVPEPVPNPQKSQIRVTVNGHEFGTLQDAAQVPGTQPDGAPAQQYRFTLPAEWLSAPAASGVSQQFIRLSNRSETSLDLSSIQLHLGPMPEAERYLIAVPTLVGGVLKIEVPVNSILQRASDILGPWTDLSNPAGVYETTPLDAAAYFRLRSP